MWPFKKQETRTLKVLHKGIAVQFNARFGFWSYADKGIEFTVYSDELDTSLIECAGEILDTIGNNRERIRSIVASHLENLCEDQQVEHLVSVEITKYLPEREFDASFAGGEEWGDLGVNIVFKNGGIVSDYCGD